MVCIKLMFISLQLDIQSFYSDIMIKTTSMHLN